MSHQRSPFGSVFGPSRRRWGGRAALLCAACATALACSTASAVPTMTFSIDYQGPSAGGVPGPFTGIPDSFFGVPMDEGSIYTPFPPGPPGTNPPAPGPLLPPGLMVSAVAGGPGVITGGLHISPGVFGGVELDALSYGRDGLVVPGNPNFRYFFSVDEFAVGNPFPTLTGGPPDVSTEGAAANMEASADVFRSQIPSGLGGFLPPGAPGGIVFGNTDVVDGDGLPPFSGPGTGLIEPNPPTPDVPDPGDNLDALDFYTTLADVTGPIYFSLDSVFDDPDAGGPPPNTGTAIGNGFVGGDVLVQTSRSTRIIPYAPAPLLGLDLIGGPDSDDLDALILVENGDGVFTPSSTPFDWVSGMTDMLLFSVRRGSQIIGMLDSIWNVPIEEGDILTVVAGRLPGIFIPAEELGLATFRTGTAASYGVINPAYGIDAWADDLDALDTIPEPATLSLIGFGFAGMGLIAWRRRKVA